MTGEKMARLYKTEPLTMEQIGAMCRPPVCRERVRQKAGVTVADSFKWRQVEKRRSLAATRTAERVERRAVARAAKLEATFKAYREGRLMDAWRDLGHGTYHTAYESARQHPDYVPKNKVPGLTEADRQALARAAVMGVIGRYWAAFGYKNLGSCSQAARAHAVGLKKTSPAHRRMMYWLRRGPRKMRDWPHSNPSTASCVSSRLAARGLLIKRPIAERGAPTELILTRKGRAWLAAWDKACGRRMESW